MKAKGKRRWKCDEVEVAVERIEKETSGQQTNKKKNKARLIKVTPYLHYTGVFVSRGDR